MHAIHPGAHDDEARVLLLVPEEAVASSFWPYVGRFSFDIGAGWELQAYPERRRYLTPAPTQVRT